MQTVHIHKWTVLHYSPFKEVWDWVILLLVLYTAVFTPYVAAFLLNEPGYKESTHTDNYGNDPMVIVDLVGMSLYFAVKVHLIFSWLCLVSVLYNPIWHLFSGYHVHHRYCYKLSDNVHQWKRGCCEWTF